MTIQIIKVNTSYSTDTGQPVSRSATFTISDGGPVYIWGRGGIPLTGSVQSFLEAEEAALFAEASAAGNLATPGEIAQAQARAWFVANSGAVSAIFGGTIDQLDANVTTLVQAMFPAATANQRTQMRYALMAGLLTCRCYAEGEGLV